MPGRSSGVTPYVALIIALTFLCNLFLGEETRALGLSVPFIVKEFGISATQLGFAQTIAAWVGLAGWFGILLLADGLGRKPAFLAVLLGYSITGPLIGFAGNFVQLGSLLALAAIPRNTGTISPCGVCVAIPRCTAPWRVTVPPPSVLSSS